MTGDSVELIEPFKPLEPLKPFESFNHLLANMFCGKRSKPFEPFKLRPGGMRGLDIFPEKKALTIEALISRDSVTG